MKAVGLAGGQEFGQCPLSRQLPRALWPVIDRPIIESVLAALRGAGIGQMAISANGRTHTIAAKLGYNPTPDVTIHYSEDTMPRGAAGCIKDCEEWLGSQTFLVCQGTRLYLGVDLPHLLEEHRKNGNAGTLAAPPENANHLDRHMQLQAAGLHVREPPVLP